jgi:DNA-binding Lrp family transcriptional regulator
MITIENIFETNGDLSAVDKAILKEMLSSNGIKTSLFLSKKLGIPLTTVQRRRKRLEKEFLEKEYLFCLEKFGWRRIDFFISTMSGKSNEIAREILNFTEAVFVGKSIGEHTIDLRLETVVKDNTQILELSEKIEAMDGVRDVVWSEIVKVVDRKIYLHNTKDSC